jgi:polysaccharide export outer membrane protein
MKRLMILLLVIVVMGTGLGAETKVPAVVYVRGAVYKPGTMPMPKEGRLTVVEAVRLAGGAVRTANLRRVTVTRRNERGELTQRVINVEAILKKEEGADDVPLQSGDTVFLGERCFGG